jgi:hypothetical protein
VNHASAVRVFQRLRDLLSVPQQSFCRQRSFFQSLFQRLSFHVLQNEILHSILIPDVIQRTNVRVVQRGNRPRFAFKSLPFLFI